MAAATDKSVVPRFYGGPVAQAATVQLAACLQQVDYVEFDVREKSLRDKLLASPLWPIDGHLEVLEGIGLGVEIDRNVLASFASTNLASTTNQGNQL